MKYLWTWFRKWVPVVRRVLVNLYYRKKWDDTLNAAKDFVCKMQGDFAAYNFQCADAHRRMKNAFKDYEENVTSDNLKSLRREISGAEGYQGFESVLNEGLIRAVEETFSAMERFFKASVDEKKAFPPRFCVKVISAGRERVFVLARDTKSGGPGNLAWPYVQKEDTGLSEVEKTGLPYMENDIPSAFSRGEYRNPRLDRSEIHRYRKPSRWKGFTKDGAFEDKDWVRCWKKDPDRDAWPPARDCYKSTLIVPISLRRNGMSEDFRLRFGGGEGSSGYENLLFGFLCADSHSEEFFEESDKKMGYIFADVLSLFLIVNLSLLEYSQTYKRARLCLDRYAGQIPFAGVPSDLL